MISAAAALLESTKALYDILTSAKGLIDSATISNAVFDVNRKALDLQAQNSLLIGEINAIKAQNTDLTEECVKLRNKENDFRRYELYAFPTGALAYRLKADNNELQPIHYLCATCYDQSKKSTLQPGVRSLHCPVCHNSIFIKPNENLHYPSSGIM